MGLGIEYIYLEVSGWHVLAIATSSTRTRSIIPARLVRTLDETLK